MLLWFIVYGGSLLQILLLVRGGWQGNYRRYPFFYFQLLCSTIAGFIFELADINHWTSSYEQWYWAVELSTMFIACGNILEILRHGFAQTAKATQFARTMRYVLGLTWCVFVGICVYSAKAWDGHQRFVVVERNFRLMQAALLLAILGALFYFGIRLNRNIRGIFLGYGVLIGSDLVTLAVEARFAAAFDSLWNVLQPFCYVLSLVIYLFSLWNYSPPVAPRLVFEAGMSGEGWVVSRLQWLRLALSRRGSPHSRSLPVSAGSLKQGR